MTCPNCGQELPDLAATCSRCGPVTGGYAGPQHYIAAHGSEPAAGWAQSAPVASAPPKRRRLLTILVGALAVVLTGGGIAVAGGFLGWYGGREQPSDVLPGSAIAYAQLDLDPSLAQKTSAWQFLRDLPEVKSALAAGLPDPKQLLWELAVTDDAVLGGTDYEADVKPWLGNRLGSVLVDHDGKGTVVAAIELTNEELGASQLREWAGQGDVKYDVTLRDGYALITDTEETSFVLGEIAKGTLATNPTFTTDFAAVGEPGISAGWADVGALATLSGPDVSTAVGVSEGRVAYAVRFTADTLEVAGITSGFIGPVAIAEGDLGNLPADTGVAIGITGGGPALAKAWSELPQEAKDSVADIGLSLPDDLVALLGNSFIVAASADTLTNLATFPETLEIGVRASSDDAARAEQVLLTLASGAVPGEDLTRVDGSILVAGTTTDYRDRMAGDGPRLTTKEWFTKAVPDHARATFAAWVDLEALAAGGSSGGGDDYKEFLSALRGWGIQFVQGDAGSGSWSVRVVRA